MTWFLAGLGFGVALYVLGWQQCRRVLLKRVDRAGLAPVTMDKLDRALESRLRFTWVFSPRCWWVGFSVTLRFSTSRVFHIQPLPCLGFDIYWRRPRP